MLSQFNCPICDANEWTQVGTHIYRASDHAPSGLWYADPYVELRRRVLFEVWFPGAVRIELKTRFCQACGFLCYSPRPTDSDIAAKYAFLRETEVDIGGQSHISETGLALDQSRAVRIYGCLNKAGAISGSGKSVLDVGGGNGKLMRPFIIDGSSCCIVDYNPHPLPGIIRLGDTVRDVPAGKKFDIVTCSHVLEHVADPVSFLREIRGVLRLDGCAYFEVPLEIWKDAPIATEPVTHVNFFTLPNLTFALVRAGYDVLQASTTVGSYGDGRLMVIWAVARPARSAAQPGPPGSSETRRLTKPGLFDVLKKLFLIEPRLERSLVPILRLPVRIMRAVFRRFTRS